MRKQINKYTIVLGLIITIFCLLIESIIRMKFSLNFAFSYLIGLFTGLFNVMLTDRKLDKIEYNTVNNPKTYYTFFHIFKILIYGIVLYFSTYLLGYYTAFTCAFGMLFHKIIIYYIYLIKDKRDDNKRTINDLNLSNEIKQKLIENKFIKVNDIIEVDRNRLLLFLNKKEVEKIIKELKKYGLFIKGELEAIIEDDKFTDV